MTPNELVAQLLISAKQIWEPLWKQLPDEQRFRLAGLEALMREITHQLVEGLWSVAALDAGQRACGRRREKRAFRGRAAA